MPDLENEGVEETSVEETVIDDDSPNPDVQGSEESDGEQEHEPSTIEDFFAEAKKELASPPPIDGNDDDEKDDEDEESTQSGEEESEEAPSAAEAETETPPGDESNQQDLKLAAQILEFMSDPATVDQALRQFNVEQIQEIPVIKNLLGRMGQSIRDQTTNEISKKQREQAVVTEAMRVGWVARNQFVEQLKNIADKFTSGEDLDSIEFVDPAEVPKIFDAYAMSAIRAHQARTWLPVEDTFSSLPEMQNLTEEQAALLASTNGQPIEKWLEARLTIGRDNLWNMALETVEETTQQWMQERETLVQKAHAAEIREMRKDYEAKLKAAKAEARAELMAEQSRSGSAPRVPTEKRKAPVSTESKGNSIRDFFNEAKEEHLASGLAV